MPFARYAEGGQRSYEIALHLIASFFRGALSDVRESGLGFLGDEVDCQFDCVRGPFVGTETDCFPARPMDRVLNRNHHDDASFVSRLVNVSSACFDARAIAGNFGDAETDALSTLIPKDEFHPHFVLSSRHPNVLRDASEA
jgi:hypothetical protein